MRLRLDLRITLDLNHQQHRANADDIANLARHFDNSARNRAFNVDCGFVRHHVNQVLVFRDIVPDLDLPFDDFRLGHAFAHIGHIECELAHSRINP